MKSLAKLSTKVLLAGALCASVSSVRADWITFPTPSTFSATEQKMLKATFLQSLVQKFFYLPQILSEMSKDKKIDLSSDSISSCLLCKDRKQEDREEIISLMGSNIIQSSFKKTDSVKKVCSQSAADSNDGIVNSVIRDTLKTYAATISMEQLEEAFEVLWSSVTSPFDLSTITDDIIEPFLEDYPDIKTHLQGIASAPGNNLCEKLAYYLANSFCNYIEELMEESACCAACKSCLKLSADYILPLVQDIVLIIQMASAI